jgi:hypothetical protein
MTVYTLKGEPTHAPEQVEAMELKHPIVLTHAEGEERGVPGDFLVSFPDGRQGIVTRQSFLWCYRRDEPTDA